MVWVGAVAAMLEVNSWVDTVMDLPPTRHLRSGPV
jgi:hypothetical protein